MTKNPSPRPDAGLARLRDGEWVVYVRAYAADGKGVKPEMTHAAEERSIRTACGRPVRFDFTPDPTDTISQIECRACRAYLDLKTK